MADYLSEDLRIRVIEAVEAGSSRRGAAARFGVSVSSAIRWVDVWRRTGRTAPYPRGGVNRPQFAGGRLLHVMRPYLMC